MSDDALAAAVAHACARWPLEACGVVVREPCGREAFVPVDNVAAHPATRFELDPHTQLALWKQAAAGAFALLAVVHSHPQGTADLSEQDRADAMAGDAPLHPGLEHWVLSIHGRPPGLVDAKAHTWSMGGWTERALLRPPGSGARICIARQKRL